MASTYPGAVDALVDPVAGDPTNDPSHSGIHTAANDAIEAVQTTLGVNPQGSAADVAERLDDIEAAMGGGGGGSYLPLTGGVLTGELDVVSPTATPSAGARQIHYGTAPPGPSDGADGDLWINDGSVTPTPQPGLVCIASQAFTASAAVNVNNVFTSAYDNYLIQVTIASASAGNVESRLRFRAASTDAATGYLSGRLYQVATTVAGSAAATTYVFAGYGPNTSGPPAFYRFDVVSPAISGGTSGLAEAVYSDGSNVYNERYAFVHTPTAVHDGFDFYPASGTITGTVRVYGYRKAA